MRHRIVREEQFSKDDHKAIEDGLNEHRTKLLGEVACANLAFFVKDEAGRTVGGVRGNWSEVGWLYVDSLWVDETLRGQGYGRKLMELIEGEAVENGCRYSYLNTMSYQAPEFYIKLGYSQFAGLEHFPAGHSRLFFRKTLR